MRIKCLIGWHKPSLKIIPPCNAKDIGYRDIVCENCDKTLVKELRIKSVHEDWDCIVNNWKSGISQLNEILEMFDEYLALPGRKDE